MLEDLEKELAAVTIQKYFKGKLGRRIALHLKYKPGGPGFIQAETEWKTNINKSRARYARAYCSHDSREGRPWIEK